MGARGLAAHPLNPYRQTEEPMPQAPIEFESFPVEQFNRIVGSDNWVVARRSPRITAKYGADVVCLSPKAYANAARLAWLATTEGFD